MASNQTEDQVRQAFASAFFAALVSALTDASGSPWSLAAASADAVPNDGGDPVWVSLTLEGALPGTFLLEFRRPDAALLASKCMRQSLGEFTSEHFQALLQAMEAAAATFCSSQAESYGSLVMRAEILAQPATEPSAKIATSLADADGSIASLGLYITPALGQAIKAHAGVEDPAPVIPAKIALPDPGNLGLVMNVELNVTLRFGQRKLTLREVLDLTSGSVIELDRHVEEPIELLLDGKVIALGEAVVIDGNYGLRVTELPKPISSASLH